MASTPSNVVSNQISPNVFAEIVGSPNVRAAHASDIVDGVAPRLVVEPGSEKEVAAVLKAAKEAGVSVIPRGGGSKLGWGNVPRRADVVLSLKRLNRVLEHAWADLTVSVEAGCGMLKLQPVLAAHRQRLAIDPLWEERATIGGVLATNDSGGLRLRFGGLRDLVIGITIALPDGTLARSGGKVVKNVAGYDLPKLLTGSLGTLAVITSANFRLHPLPKNARTLTCSYRTAADVNGSLMCLLNSDVVTSGIQIRGNGEQFQLDAKFEGNDAAIEAQAAKFRTIVSNLISEDSSAWSARERLFNHSDSMLVSKCGTLASQLGLFYENVRNIAGPHQAKWSVVSQATGISYLKLEASSEALLMMAKTLRGQLESEGGSFVVLQSPKPIKHNFDVWGATGNALPLMQRIKQQFDPSGILNPGRFYGAI